jgi:ferredoxin
MKREIIRIDEEKCNGCGLCIPNCPEGALQIIDGKARLISDLFCDGLGACIGHCPEGAIEVEEREAEPYDERKAMANVAAHGENTILAHLEHLDDHGEKDLLREAIAYLNEQGMDVPDRFRERRAEKMSMEVTGCPGCKVEDFRPEAESRAEGPTDQDVAPLAPRRSTLRQWPVQIHLVPPSAPYLQHADLLIAADCVPFAFAGFHEELLEGKTLLVGCPKLDDTAFYLEKLTEIFKRNDVSSVTVAQMEVPCCFGMTKIVKAALQAAGKDTPVESIVIGIKGDILM